MNKEKYERIRELQKGTSSKLQGKAKTQPILASKNRGASFGCNFPPRPPPVIYIGISMFHIRSRSLPPSLPSFAGTVSRRYCSENGVALKTGLASCLSRTLGQVRPSYTSADHHPQSVLESFSAVSTGKRENPSSVNEDQG